MMRIPLARERGAALAIGLILLVVLTLLAFTGMNAATTELFMAGNEQHRKSAAHAAGAGIEQAIANLRNVPAVVGAAPRELDGNLRADSAIEQYQTDTVYIGDEAGLPQSSVDKFVGMHFEIRSTGISARGARDGQVQGLFVVSTQRAGEGNSFGQTGSGLAE
jgi:type IV pilus assembly protein PilX